MDHLPEPALEAGERIILRGHGQANTTDDQQGD
jgi:hypothetical protein